ncbi:MAG: hypothetical protein KAI70_05330, partial [Candidatus Omnitrophica bacterium]|nr:hypothetical protein [Candidatus Omnitrophota bacterium]
MRLRIFLSILILSVLGVMMGLINIQIFHHEKYRIMSEENRLKVVPLMAPRGRILDRKGEILVKDVLSFNASVIYGRIKNMDLLTNFLSTILELSEKEISDKIKKARTMPYSPVCVVSDIGTEKAVQLEESREDYPGFLLEVSTMRKYGYERTAASLLGYLGFINRSEFDKLRHYGYRINDLKGKGGVEKYYDDYLRGKHGGKQIEVDHRGRESTILGFKEPTPGLDVHLTIDVELQEFCDDLLKDKRGAIIVMDPNTGAVLTMASAPAYDPNIFIDGSRSAEVISLLKNNKYPLINRAISGAYPP